MGEIMVDKKQSIIFGILIFLGFFDILGRGVLVLAFVAVLMLLLGSTSKMRISSLGAWMMIFTLAHAFWAVFLEGFNVRGAIHPLTALLLFFAGKICVAHGDGESTFQRYFLIVALGAACYGLVNMFLNVSEYGLNFNGVRILKDLWEEKDTLATGQSALFVPLVGMLYYVLVYFNADKKKIIKWLMLLAVIGLGIIYNIMAASRYVLFVSILVVALCFIIDLYQRKKNLSRFLIRAGAVVVVGIIAYSVNLFSIRSFWENSSLLQRMNNLEGLEENVYSSHARTEQFAKVLQNFHLFIGGDKPMGDPFIHNAWLSVLNYGGLFLFIPFTALTIIGAITAYKVAKKSGKGTSFLIIGVFVSLYGFFMIEPLFEGAKWLFLALSFMLGMLDTLNQSKNTKGLLNQK